MTRRPMRKQESPPEPFIPDYMRISLKRTTKKRFEEMRRDKQFVTAERPIGFIYEKENERLIFITENHEWYEGMLYPEHTADMFMKYKTEGIKFGAPEILFMDMEDKEAA